MVTHCDREFNGPEYTFLDPEDTRLVRKTLCEDRDCDVVLREMYDVTRCIHVDDETEIPPNGSTCQDILQAAEDQLAECNEGPRVLPDIETAELAHNTLHDETFSIVYEPPELGNAFVLYFEQTRVGQTRSAPRTL